jgi:hypothetical protein
MGGRVVEGTGLENRQARKRLEGSNPSPSANSYTNTLNMQCILDLPGAIPLANPHYFR